MRCRGSKTNVGLTETLKKWVAGTKVGLNEQTCSPLMGAVSDRQATPGVTGLSRSRVHIDTAVWYIAIGLGHPGGAGAAKGWVVHPLKTYISWVQNVARQFGGICWECLVN